MPVRYSRLSLATVARITLFIMVSCLALSGIFGQTIVSAESLKTSNSSTLRLQFKTALIGNAEVVLRVKSSEKDFTLYRGYITSRRARAVPQKVTAVRIKNTTPEKIIINFLLASNTSQRSVELTLSGSKKVSLKSAPKVALETKTCGEFDTQKSTVAPTLKVPLETTAATAYNPRAAAPKYFATIAVDCDAGCAASLGASEARAKIAQFVNTVSSIYEDQFGISLVLKNTLVRSSTSIYPTNISDASQLLNTFRVRARDLGTANIRHLLTASRSVSNNIAGLSYVGPICVDPAFSVGWTKHFNSLFTPFIMAHEIGHTFGADHDPDSIGIMAAVLQLPLPTTFSTFSSNQIIDHLNSLGSKLCLANSAAAALTATENSDVSSEIATQLTAAITLSKESFSIRLAVANQTGSSCTVVANVGRNANEVRSSPLFVLSGSVTPDKKSMSFSTRNKKLLASLPWGNVQVRAQATCDGLDKTLRASSTLKFSGSTKVNLKKWLLSANTTLKTK